MLESRAIPSSVRLTSHRSNPKGLDRPKIGTELPLCVGVLHRRTVEVSYGT